MKTRKMKKLLCIKLKMFISRPLSNKLTFDYIQILDYMSPLPVFDNNQNK